MDIVGHKCIIMYCLGATAFSDAYFGEGKGTIHFDFIKCSNSDQSLIECVMGKNATSTHITDVGVKCTPGNFHKNIFCFS